MAKQPTHSSGHIQKPCPQELLWNENPSAYQAPIGSQACQNTSGAYLYAWKCKYFQLLSTETKAPESQGRSSAISSFATISCVFQVFPIPPHSCHFYEILVSEINLANLSKWWTLGLLCCIWNGWSQVVFNIRHHHHSTDIIKHSFLLHLGIWCSRRITLEFLHLELSFSSLG